MSLETFSIIKHPVTTEKNVKIMQNENKLVFIVDRRASKQDIKKDAETLFKVKVIKVTTLILPSGEKKAFVKLAAETPAIDVATQLGLL